MTSRRGLMKGTVEVLGSTYRITTSKALRVGDEVMVETGLAEHGCRNDVAFLTPSDATRLSDQKRMVRGVTVLTVAEVNHKKLEIRLAGADGWLPIHRTCPCIIR